MLVNREEIQQILLNIVLNAEQAMRGAGRPGRLSIRTLRAGTSDVAVEVQDDGPGVPQALAGRIFEPFFTTKDVGEGTGLGLSLAIGIAEAHGGSLALMPVSSGACFRLTLPTTTMPAVDTPALVGNQVRAHWAMGGAPSWPTTSQPCGKCFSACSTNVGSSSTSPKTASPLVTCSSAITMT